MCSTGDSDNQSHLESVHEDLLVEGCVLVSGKEKQLKLMHNGIILGDQANNSSSIKNKALSLSWRDVICAVKDSKSPPTDTLLSFTLHYIDHKANNKLKVQTLTVTDKDGHADKWISAVNENCHKVSGRPKKAFVLVNTIGGAKRGKEIFLKTVAPLFDLAGVHITVSFTERSKHGLELGEHQDFSGYDVIVIVGGDGSYQEFLHGITLQTQKKAGVDYNNPDSIFVKPGISFGIIPAGSANCLSGLCNGTTDIDTAVLNIIRGESIKTQIFTVHSQGKFITVCSGGFAYGELSDFAKLTDERRWMGRWRYLFCTLGMMTKKPRMFKCNIEYRSADKQEKESDISSGATSNQESEWTVYTSNSDPVCEFFSSTHELIVDGKDIIFRPDGKCIDLIIDFGCTRLDKLKTLQKCVTGKNAAEPMPPKVERISRITGFRIKVVPSVTEDDETITPARAKEMELERFLNIDGEVVRVDKPELDIRVHSEFVAIYGCPRSLGAVKVK